MLPLRFLGLVTVVVAAIVLGAASVYAGDDLCPEPNDQPGNACQLAVDSPVQGFLSSYDDWDLYAISVQAQGGTLRVDMDPPGDYRVGLLRSDGSEIVKPLGEGVAPRQFRIAKVPDGIYYIQIGSGSGDYSPDIPYTVSYTIEDYGAAMRAVELIQARPEDLVLRLDEAGKNAKEGKATAGTGDTGPWRQVSFERPFTYANAHSGPVVIVEKLILSPDVGAAQKAFNDLSGQDFPEATAKRKGKFIPAVDPRGDDFYMVGSCENGCDEKDPNTHFRTVVRYANAVFVVYTFGYGGSGGNDEAGALVIVDAALKHLK